MMIVLVEEIIRRLEARGELYIAHCEIYKGREWAFKVYDHGQEGHPLVASYYERILGRDDDTLSGLLNELKKT